MRLLFVTYIALTVSVTLLPLTIGMPVPRRFVYMKLNFIPILPIINEVKEIGTAYDGDVFFMIKLIVKNVIGNVILLMPLGFLAPLLWKKTNELLKMFLIGLVTSICIESLQFIEIVFGIGDLRAVDINDVICNSLGAVLGFGLLKLVLSKQTRGYIDENKNLER
ncbi:VanZ family protein [Pullulanibacillus sp. KACC 23026]|uniref:VanZ family protein n=1 Tax=Pullulanibacillus sp. KACC 23026 TaxID=3028315 RepID=UPI0023B0C522|nr:VanZ family protein [Pullulanibacillus sp. KACC 23026]WEG14414.1 VanZ family protein [Pullulanibacillus sp. KACC 23026]